MKKSIICLFSILLLLTSCFVDDDSCEPCLEDCTEFKGQITTADGKGVSGLRMSVKFIETNIFLSAVRIITTTKTDENGYYEMSGYLRDYEVQGSYNLELSFEIENANKIISNDFLKPKLQTDVGLKYLNKASVSFYGLKKRDTVLRNNFIIPKKGNLSVKLKNFKPILEDDYFIVSVDYSYAFLSKGWRSYSPSSIGRKSAVANRSETVLNIETILNGTVVVSVSKKKNGVIENTKQVIKLTSPAVFNLEFNY